MSERILYYFGDDKVFFSGLKAMLSTHSQTISLKKFFASQESAIQSLFTEVSEGLPDAVLIDFSLHKEDYLHLARILSRTPFKKNIKIIGILDHLKTNQLLTEVLSTGLSLCFIKSDHIKDIAITLMQLVYPGKVSTPSYVKVKLQESWTAGLVSKVGFIIENGLHFETNLKLEVGQQVQLEHFWRNKTLIPSKEVTIKNVEEKNLVYNFNYAVDAEFVFIDRPTEDLEPADEVKRLSQIEDAQYRFKKIFQKNKESSQGKKAKVLLIDSEFLIYKDKKRSDRFPYMIRCLGSEVNIQGELSKFNPHIIVFSLDEIITENTVALVKDWCNNQGVSPYFIIFKSELNVTQWQEKLNYQSLLASAEELNTEVLLKMAQVFAKKIEDIENQSKKIFISKHKEESICEVEVTIRVVHLSESEILFTTERPIPLTSNLIIRSPIKTLVYLAAEQEQNGLYQYQGILHSHDELEKNSIRRYINAALFRENEVQVADKSALVGPDAKLKEILKKSHLKSED